MSPHIFEKQLTAVFEGESDLIANMANMAAFLYHELADVNWVGFYLKKGNDLVLGPFQGKVACVRIAVGKGVCGTAARDKKTTVVADVHKFDGHIACDSASNSEIVIPVIFNNKLIAVFDVDSPLYNRFNESDKRLLENLVDIFIKNTSFE
ncbi:MAG: GAF domain-containing protein [Calditrichae bacterium]|nr:GAF domain-containing protein [Calditrichia bacterium]